MLDFEKVLTSDRVLLRPMVLEDVERMEGLTKDASLWKYFTEDLSSVDELRHWVTQAVSDLKRQVSLPFTIVEQPTGAVVGSTRIANISKRHQRVEIGWTWLSTARHGTGLNHEVKWMLLDYLFAETKVQRVEFKTDVLNLKARKSMKRLGLFEEGVLRSHTVMVGGRRRDTVYYSMLRSEWPTLTKNGRKERFAT